MSSILKFLKKVPGWLVGLVVSAPAVVWALSLLKKLRDERARNDVLVQSNLRMAASMERIRSIRQAERDTISDIEVEHNAQEDRVEQELLNLEVPGNSAATAANRIDRIRERRRARRDL